MKIYLNGELVDKENAKISVFDHGLLYGDGVFEGIRLYDGCVYKLDEHLERSELFGQSHLLETYPWIEGDLRRLFVRPAGKIILRMGMSAWWLPGAWPPWTYPGWMWSSQRDHYCG